MYEIVFISLHSIDPIIVLHKPDEDNAVKVEYIAPEKVGEEALFVVKEGYSKVVAAYRASEVVGWSIHKLDDDAV
jgi:hypothetical protein